MYLASLQSHLFKYKALHHYTTFTLVEIILSQSDKEKIDIINKGHKGLCACALWTSL